MRLLFPLQQAVNIGGLGNTTGIEHGVFQTNSFHKQHRKQ